MLSSDTAEKLGESRALEDEAKRGQRFRGGSLTLEASFPSGLFLGDPALH